MSARYATIAEIQEAESQIHRDPLSTDRTILANERTMLAYVRTAVTMLAGGLTFINFFPSSSAKIIGWIILVPAVAILIVGMRRYYSLKKSLASHFEVR